MSANGTPLIARIKRLYSTTDRLEIEVPEWECSLYFTPYTGDERDAINAVPGDAGLRAAEFVIRKAQKEDGTPAFSRVDRPYLYRTASMVIIERLVQLASEWSPASLDPEE